MLSGWGDAMVVGGWCVTDAQDAKPESKQVISGVVARGVGMIFCLFYPSTGVRNGRC